MHMTVVMRVIMIMVAIRTVDVAFMAMIVTVIAVWAMHMAVAVTGGYQRAERQRAGAEKAGFNKAEFLAHGA